MTDKHQNFEQPGLPEAAQTFILRLLPGPAEPPAGSIARAEGGPALAFRGWIGFMSAINQLRAEPGHPAIDEDPP